MDVHKNFAASTIVTPPAPATSGLSLTVAAGEGARFAAPVNLTAWPPGVPATGLNAEILRVASIAGDVFTLGSRAQESTPARSIAAGWQIADTLTVATLNLLAAKDTANVFTAPQEVQVSGGSHGLRVRDTGAPANLQLWTLTAGNGGYFYVVTLNDDFSGKMAIIFSQAGSIYLPGDVLEKNRTTPMGHWVDEPFVASNFYSAAGGGWIVTSGAVGLNRYTLIGKTLLWTVYLQGTTITGGGSGQLYIKLPGGLTGAATPFGIGYGSPVGQVYDAAGLVDGLVYQTGNSVALQKNNNAAWVAGASPVVLFTVTLEIQ